MFDTFASAGASVSFVGASLWLVSQLKIKNTSLRLALAGVLNMPNENKKTIKGEKSFALFYRE